MERIAIIDDNIRFCESLRELLEQHFDEVEVYSSVTAAKAGLKAFNPSVILCDINLGDGHGQEVISALRSDAFFELTPIIVITSQQDIDHETLIAAGAYEVLIKPVSFSSLKKTISKAINKREQFKLFSLIKSPLSLISSQINKRRNA